MKTNRTLKNKFATKIQSRVRGLSLRNKRRGVNIGNILCNETKEYDIKTEIAEYYNIKLKELPLKSIDNLRLYNCSFGNKDLRGITKSINYSTIFNVSFASAKLQSIVFTNVVFLSGRKASQPYKLFTKYYPIDNDIMVSRKKSKKSQSVACDFRNTNLQGCKFTNCTFNSIQFESSKISSVIFQECKFINCSFTSCIFEIKEEPNSVFFSDCDIIFDEHTSNTEFIIHSESVNNSIGLDKCLYKFNKCKFINYCHEVRKIKIISNSLDRNSIIKYIYLVKCDIKSYFINDLLLLALNEDEYLFYQCNFEDCKFFNSTITSNTFFVCTLKNCNFSIATFQFGARFENNKFISCYFYAIRIIIEQNTIPIIIFNTDFTGSQFINTNLAYITFEQCNMYGCDFSPRLIQLPDGRQQTILTIFYDQNNPNESSTKFIESNIKSCNFSQTMGLIGHDFRKVKDRDLTSVNFTGVELQNSDLEGCKITGTIFAYATLTGCNFRDVREFQNADFTGIVGVPDNIPDGLNINAEILASNEVHTRFSLFKTRHFDSSIRFFVSFCEEKSSVRMINPDETFTGIEKEIKGLTSDKPQKGEYYDFHEIVNNVDKFKEIFIKIYTGILSEPELDKLKQNLDKCIDHNFINSINKDTNTCNIIMHSLLFLLYQCKFYKQNFIDLYIEEIFNAHGKNSMSCLLGMIERLVTTHCACIATINSLLKPYKTLEELKKKDELYKLFDDLDEELFRIYTTATKYTFNKLLNLIIPTSLLAESDEEEKLFDEIMGHLEINFSLIREEWFKRMQEYYKIKVKLDNKESVEKNDTSIVEKVHQLIKDGVFKDISKLLENYEKTIIENPDINRDIVSKLESIKQTYDQEYISKKCDEIMRILNSKIADEKKLVMESIFGLVGKSRNIDENDITEYLEGGKKRNNTTRKSKAKGKAKAKDKVKVKAKGISKTTEKTRISYENVEKLIIDQFLSSNKEIYSLANYQHIDIKKIDERRIKYYFDRYNN